MTGARARLLALGLLLALVARPAAGQGLVSPLEVDEGRPVTVRVTWVQPGDSPALIASLVATVGGFSASLPPAPEVAVAPLAPLSGELVSLELVAEEALGAEARAPRPPVRVALAGEPWRLARQVVPDERLVLEVAIIPVAGEPLAVSFAADLVLLDPARGGPSLAGCRVRGASQAWTAELPRPTDAAGEADPLGLRAEDGAEDTPARPPGAGVSLRVNLVRWVPPGPGPAPELLVRAQELVLPRAGSERRELQLPEQVVVRPAAFGRAAAYARAGIQAADLAVRIGEMWALDEAGQVAVVAPEGEIVRADGALGGWGLRLAREGRATATAHTATDSRLARALEAAGLVRALGKGVVVEVGPQTLATFVRVLRDQGARLRDGAVVEGR